MANLHIKTFFILVLPVIMVLSCVKNITEEEKSYLESAEKDQKEFLSLVNKYDADTTYFRSLLDNHFSFERRERVGTDKLYYLNGIIEDLDIIDGRHHVFVWASSPQHSTYLLNLACDSLLFNRIVKEMRNNNKRDNGRFVVSLKSIKKGAFGLNSNVIEYGGINEGGIYEEPDIGVYVDFYNEHYFINGELIDFILRNREK